MWGDVIREEEIQRQALGEAYGRLPLIGVVSSSRYDVCLVEKLASRCIGFPHNYTVNVNILCLVDTTKELW